VENRKDEVRWLCQCDCEKEVIVDGHSLKLNRTKSCGCFRKDYLKKQKRRLTHGKRFTRIYKTWESMKARCYNPKTERYPRYGGRGIVVCDEWRTNFEAFYNWAISHGYKDELTIDRIDNDGNYEPTNCQWLTRSENSRKAHAKLA